MPYLLKFFIAVILGLLVVFFIDPLDKSTACTPFCLSILLMALSLRQNIALLVPVIAVYCCLCVYALVTYSYFHTAIHPLFWLSLRMGLFLVVCALCLYLTIYRTETEGQIVRIQTILSRLPAPVIISDGSGYITYANDATRAAFKLSSADLKGLRYFDYFTTDYPKGQAIATYFEFFEMQSDNTHEMVLQTVHDRAKMNAYLSCLGTGNHRVMITLLLPWTGKLAVDDEIGSPS